jgi:hypothetical protein
MPKRPLKITVRLPPYTYPRTAWRKAIHQAVMERLKASRVEYTDADRLALSVRLYFNKDLLEIVDVDNRLKDVMDALQGHVGGHGKKQRSLTAIIPNDNQVFRVTVEKSLAPKQSAHGRGHLTIAKY